MLLAGEMWSVVTESPSNARTRAPLMSLTGSGSAGIPSKYGGLRPYVESSAHPKGLPPGGGRVAPAAAPLKPIVGPLEGVAARRRKVAPALVALEHIGVVADEHLLVDSRRDGVRDVLLGGPDVFQEDVIAVLVGAQRVGLE